MKKEERKNYVQRTESIKSVRSYTPRYNRFESFKWVCDLLFIVSHVILDKTAFPEKEKKPFSFTWFFLFFYCRNRYVRFIIYRTTYIYACSIYFGVCLELLISALSKNFDCAVN